MPTAVRFVLARVVSVLACLVTLGAIGLADDGLWQTDFEAAKAKAKAVLDQVLALPGLSGEQKQDAYFAQGECFFNRRDFSGVVASLKKALESAPDGPKAATLKTLIPRYAPVAEAQEAVAKIQGEVDKAQGLERAKLLDQLLDARAKLSPYVPDAASSQDTAKTWQEIIQLDPDNKAGLKRKYEFRAMLAEAESLLRAQKPGESQALLDKALAVPGLTGAETQEAHFAKGRGHLGQKESQKALDCFKKGLAAAPDGPRAALLTALIPRVEDELEKQKPDGQPKTPEPKKEAAK